MAGLYLIRTRLSDTLAVRIGLPVHSYVELRLIQSLYSSVVERQSCKLKVLGSIPSGGWCHMRTEC